MKITAFFFSLMISILYFSCSKNEQNLTEKKTVNKYDKALLSYKVYKVDSGWGYKIYKNKKVFIKQPIIPAINATIPFKTKKDAEKVAKLVIEKMQKQIGLPSISIEELDSLGVLDSILYNEKLKIRNY